MVETIGLPRRKDGSVRRPFVSAAIPDTEEKWPPLRDNESRRRGTFKQVSFSFVAFVLFPSELFFELIFLFKE